MNNENQDLDNLRHSASHLMAAAVMELWPDAKCTIGPVIENGFYYDFDFSKPVSESDLPKIEEKMREIAPTWKAFERSEVSVGDARKHFSGNEYKLELIDELAGKNEVITFYKSGNFTDLCRGGHIEHPDKELKYFKLLSIAGAYWRGDEKNKMLTRIYGTIFPSQKELDDYLQMLEEAKKRDHRRIGKDLGLFTFSDLVGSGLPLYTQRGAFIRRALANYIEELQSRQGYMQVWTPQIAKAELFKRSGHYDKYHDSMFRVVSNFSDEEFYLKPMNCPQHTQIYASQLHSYRDLPVRMTDFAMLYRDEKPGEINGLARVRSFSQDDCHIFCTEEQVDREIDVALQMIKEAMGKFGLKYRYRLSTRDPQHPEKYLGKPETWDKVEKWAEKIMKRNNIEYYDGPGEAAFYAPKMDLMATDALGREWQLSTVQIDFVMPERFDLKYIDSDGQEKCPVMLHRAILGSAERFMMIILEHFAGALPAWLSPEQVAIIPISDQNVEYANKLAENLRQKQINVVVDSDKERMQNKIRKAQEMKIPYMLIVGKQEEADNTVSVRLRTGEEIKGMKADEFVQKLVANVKNRKLELTL